MKDFWQNPKVKNYLINDLFDIDEIVRRYGSCPNDEDYKIVRSYYYWEWQGDEEWKIVDCNKEEYEKYKDSEESGEIYRTELNYKDFEDKFWFHEFTDTISGQVEVFSRFDLIDEINNTFYEMKFEGQAKYFLREILQGLESVIRQLNRILKWTKDTHGYDINKIQLFVIQTYIKSYTYCIKEIIDNYNFIFPEIKNYINQNNEYPRNNPNTELNTIWQKLGNLIAVGTIEFEKIKNIGNQIKYNNKIFESGNSLAKELSEEWEINQQSLRAYITDTMNSNMKLNSKNIFNSLKKAEFLNSFCKENEIEPSSFLKFKLEELRKAKP
jgi:hypothetical protein